jgi:4-hydroxythreonine-4-phosphate dehydrogenase
MAAALKPLALSMGDPAGIGPEIASKAWAALREAGPSFAVLGDPACFAQTGAPLEIIDTIEDATRVFARALPVLRCASAGPVQAKTPNPAHARAILSAIEEGVRLCLAGRAAALVTNPIAKAPLYAAGFGFPGHTEFLGELTKHAPVSGPRGPLMMLAVPGLRVALATVHVPLKDVAAALTPAKIVAVHDVLRHALRQDFGITAPRIAVAALNPHAGEAGQIGREEIEIIAPALADMPGALGPFAADTMFHPQARAGYDAALCMYHDQALIPLKTIDFWGGVNVTLGLPIVRTSPDHGVGYDIAGEGRARPDSLIAALRMAGEIAQRRAAA